MNERIFVFSWLLLTVALLASSAAEAQQAKKVPRIGFLVSGSASGYTSRIDAFRKGLHELGYVEGKNILIEYRYSQGNLPQLAADLVRLNVSTIVAATGNGARGAMAATQTIPIVFALTSQDPVKVGLVSSLARPGGNITGLTILDPELNEKRLELLKEAFPNITRIAFLGRDVHFFEAEVSAKGMGFQLQLLRSAAVDYIESAFKAAKSACAQALLASPSIFLITHTGHGSSTWRRKTGCPRYTQCLIMRRQEVSCPTDPTIPITFGAPLFTWIKFSKAPSLLIFPSSSRRSLS